MTKATDRRKQELALIHCAKRDLRLADDVYRDVLWSVARVRSAKDLDGHGRQRVLEHFKGLGWKVGRPPYAGRRHPNKAPKDSQAYMTKIEAQLADMQLPWSYADGVAKQMFKVDTVRFCQPHQLRKVVAALAYEQKKRGAVAGAERLANSRLAAEAAAAIADEVKDE